MGSEPPGIVLGLGLFTGRGFRVSRMPSSTLVPLFWGVSVPL